MKITVVFPHYTPKPVGSFKIMYEYANQLVARGHEVTVVNPRRLANLGRPPLTKPYLWLTGKARQSGNSNFTPEVPWHPIDSHVKMIPVPVFLNLRYNILPMVMQYLLPSGQ